MGDWANTVADRHAEVGFFNITPSATAHTKGVWDGPFSTAGGCGLILHLSWMQVYGTARTLLFDIGIGSSGSQVVLVQNIIVQPPSGGSSTSRAHQQEVYLPITVPAGVLWIRAQSSMASHAIVYSQLTVVSGGTPAFGAVCTTYGVNTATSLGTLVTAPTTDNVLSGWVQITPSCARVRAVLLAVNGGTTAMNAFSDQWHSFEIGVGPAGSEVQLVPIYEGGGACSATGIITPQILGPYNVDISSGTRISIRVRVQWTSSAQRDRYFSLYGIS